MLIRFGYRAVDEQHQPSRLLNFAVLAEKVGFEFICIGDHFNPWFHKGGCAGHAWVWLGAAGAKTGKVRLGTGVTTCLYRYHPAIVAQAFATLDELYPGRIFLGIGTGESMNEMILGFDYPNFKERLERTAEAVAIIKTLWTKDLVDFKGKYFSLRRATLYTRPKERIPIYFAAAGPKSARIAGRLGDALMMASSAHPIHEHARMIFASYEEGVKESGRKPQDMLKMMEMKISYDEDYDKALNSLSPWKISVIPNINSKSLINPRELDKMGDKIYVGKLAHRVCTSMEQVIKKIEEYIEIGFNEIQIGSSSPDEEKFILEFGKKALPYLQDRYSS